MHLDHQATAAELGPEIAAAAGSSAATTGPGRGPGRIQTEARRPRRQAGKVEGQRRLASAVVVVVGPPALTSCVFFSILGPGPILGLVRVRGTRRLQRLECNVTAFLGVLW